MISKLIILVVVLVVVREVLAHLLGWSADGLGELLANRKHNRSIDKKWREDGRPILSTTIGWRRDPNNKEDGYRKDPPNGQDYYGDGYSYSKLIRGGTEEYRKKFAEDVEKSKRE